ncbi:MAG: GNAT family N-acetyltransferase [Gammaproteobacteria bacterium]
MLSTARLLLRRPVPADAPAMFEYGADEAVTRWLDWPRRTDIGEVSAFIERCATRWTAGEEYYWVVTERGDDTAIGAVSSQVAGADADVGFLLSQRCWGRGIATEAAAAVVDWLWAQPALKRLVAVCATENHASARVLEKLGLARRGVAPGLLACPNLSGTPLDAIVFARERK